MSYYRRMYIAHPMHLTAGLVIHDAYHQLTIIEMTRELKDSTAIETVRSMYFVLNQSPVPLEKNITCQAFEYFILAKDTGLYEWLRGEDVAQNMLAATSGPYMRALGIRTPRAAKYQLHKVISEYLTPWRRELLHWWIGLWTSGSRPSVTLDRLLHLPPKSGVKAAAMRYAAMERDKYRAQKRAAKAQQGTGESAPLSKEQRKNALKLLDQWE